MLRIRFPHAGKTPARAAMMEASENPENRRNPMNALKPAAIALAAIVLAAGAGWALLSAVTGEGAPRYRATSA